MKEIKRGWYKMREFPLAGLPDVMTVFVKGVYEYGDGKKFVSFLYNFPFIIREEMYLEDFRANVVLK